MIAMGRLQYGRLSDAWKGEATEFTPLLAAQLDQVGAAIGVDLASLGQSEVLTTGGRRIDIVARGSDGSEFVVENQYGRADHDHLTRGLAYAVARRARGLIVVAEEHRDEFRAVAQYLNELAEFDPERGIAVWLLEVKAVRIGDSSWAPLFSAVVEPNQFTTTVERAKQSQVIPTMEEFWQQFAAESTASAVQELLQSWLSAGHRRRLNPNNLVLEARGPSANGVRAVIAVFSDGRVQVPFGSYAGQNSGIEVAALSTPEFRARADSLFGFNGSERQAQTPPGWFDPAKTEAVLGFCLEVAAAYRDALSSPAHPDPTL
jgi:hypothetical protein